MTPAEFSNWIDQARDCFPSIGKLIDDAVDKSGLLFRWRKAFETTSPETASQFLDALLDGTIETPRFQSDWATLPGMARRWCREHAPLESSQPVTAYSQFDGPRYQCMDCFDKGYGVEVLNPVWVRRHESQIADGLPVDWWIAARLWCRAERVGPLIYSCVCREGCSHGDRVQDGRKEKHRQRYNPVMHLKTRGYPTPDELSAWVENLPPIEATNSWNPGEFDYAGSD